MAINDEIPKSRITLTYRTEVKGEPEDVTIPFRMLVMGDLSNGTSRDRRVDLDQRQIRTLDGKNLDAVMRDMNMTLKLSVPNRINPAEGDGEMEVTLPIRGVRSFSPGEVAKNVPKIRSLLLLKKLLLEAQANLDNRKEFRKLLQDLAARKGVDAKDIVLEMRAALKDYQTFHLPERKADPNTPPTGK